MTSTLRILHLPIHGSGVAFYRHHLPLTALRKAGHIVTSPSDGLANWITSTSKDDGSGYFEWLNDELGKGYDIIHSGWSNNLHHIEMLVAAREKWKTHVVVDYDDDVLNVDKFNLSYKSYQEGAYSRRVARLGMRIADAISVSTTPLLSALAGNYRSAHCLQNFTHPPMWQDLPVDPQRADDKSIRIMFAGGQSHLGDISTVKNAMLELLKRYDGTDGRPHIKLIFVSCMPDWMADYIQDRRNPTANRAFFVQGGPSVDLWYRCIRWVSPDIFIAPILHNKFNESKSLIKAYDAAMVPGCAFICEDWPTYADVPDEACLRPNNTHERSGGWMEALVPAIEDAALRHKLSAKLLEWVLDCRTIDGNIHLWEAAYQQVLGTPVVKDLSDIVRPRIYAPDGSLAGGD